MQNFRCSTQQKKACTDYVEDKLVKHFHKNSISKILMKETAKRFEIKECGLGRNENDTFIFEIDFK